MATIHNKYIWGGSGNPVNANYKGLPFNYSRGNPVPLDETSYFDSISDAQEYAKNGATAYVGQLLTIVEKKVVDETTTYNVSIYKITDTAGTIVQIDGEVAIPDAPEYKIVKEVVEGKHQFYLTKNNIKVGDSISFSDMVVTGGELVTFTDTDKPEGLTAGTYLKLTIANQENPVYINVKELIDVYSGGDTTTVNVSVDGNKITAGVNGKSITGGANGHIAEKTITTVNIADSAVTTDKINDKAVTVAKLANDVLTHFSIPGHTHVLNNITDLSDLSYEHEAEENKFITSITQVNGKITGVTTSTVDVTSDITKALGDIDNTVSITQPTEANGTINIITSIVQTDAHLKSVGKQTIDIGSVIGLSDYLLASTLTATSPDLATKQVTKADKLVVNTTMTGAIDTAIKALDSTLTASAPQAGKVNVITSLTQTDGKLTNWQFTEIDISTVISLSNYSTKAYVNGISTSLSSTISSTYLSVSAFKSELEKYTYSKFSNPVTVQEKLVNKQYVDTAITNLGTVFEFKGVLTALPTEFTGYKVGDVVIVDSQEYVVVERNSNKGWEPFGTPNAVTEQIENIDTRLSTVEQTYLTKVEAAETYVKVQDLVIDCGGASDTDLTPTAEKWFGIDTTTSTLTAFTATTADLGTTVVVVPETVNGTKVASVGTAFVDKAWITAIYIPVGIDIPTGAFSGCTKLPTDADGVMYTNY